MESKLGDALLKYLRNLLIDIDCDKFPACHHNANRRELAKCFTNFTQLSCRVLPWRWSFDLLIFLGKQPAQQSAPCYDSLTGAGVTGTLLYLLTLLHAWLNVVTGVTQ